MISKTSNSGIALIIFGVTGDLAHRKLVPALYQLERAKQLPEQFHIIGFARRDWSDEKLRSAMEAAVREHSRTQPIDGGSLQRVLKRMHYLASNFTEESGYRELHKQLKEL